MQYLGGKKSIAKELAAVLQSFRVEGAPFYDVFCGSCAVVAEMDGVRFANDGNAALINMFEAWRAGWRPPQDVSFEDHARLRIAQDPTDPVTAFVAHACSYGGMWFSTYARDRKNGRNFAATGARSLERTLSKCADVTFTALDYRALTPQRGVLIYCDPPYDGTTGYAGMPKFDTAEFWQVAARWAETCTVLVSEYVAPSGWRGVWTRPVRKSRLAGQRVERLFARC